MLLKNIERSYALSPMQQGMLFHSLAAPDEGVYVQQLVMGLHEELDVSAFERAWQRVMARHAILRTRFRWEGLDEPLQDVYQQVALPLIEQDWRDLSASEQEKRLNAYLQADQERGFILTEVPLMRLALFRVAEADYQFVWSSHHALLDGRARLLLLKELFAFYEAFCEGQALELQQPRPFQEQIEWLQQQDLSKAEAFWRQSVGGFSAPTSLVVDQAFDSGEASYGEQGIRLSEAVTSTLKSLAQQHELTLNTMFQGAWSLLLSRYNGSDLSRVLFGATRACRWSAVTGAKSMVGLFINTLPMSVRVSPEMPLLPWLKEVRAQHVALREYEHTPLAKIQEWSEMPGGTPLFESILVFENYRLHSTLRALGGKWERRDVQLLERTNYPLTVSGYAGPELELSIGYDKRRFDDATIARMLRHLKTLLTGMSRDLSQPLGSLPLLTEAERHQLLVEWNDTQADYPNALCIHQLFEAQAERTPHAMAVVSPSMGPFEDERLTYEELNQRANQLAHHLRALGVGPDVLVGICVERELSVAIGLLGILKAGGAYVPLDPAYPKERLAFMSQDAQLSVLLTQEQLLSAVPEHGATVVCLDRDWQMIARQSKENPNSGVMADNLAYVIYTSGSTGLPKGVLIRHQSLVNHAVAIAKQCGLRSDDRILQFASINFDAAAEELYPSWLSGATVILRTDEMLLSPDKLVPLIQKEKLTVLNLPTSYWHQWVHDLSQRAKPLPASLRLTIVGGEKASAARLQSWLQLKGAAQIDWIDTYGPTETTITATLYELAQKPEIEQIQEIPSPLAIGRPIANTQIYVLDSHMQPVPVGVPGEMYIGGDGLARGYLNRPELNEEKFIPNPFSHLPPELGGVRGASTRLYKSGDLARYLPDGNIEFLGRIDNQVKIRGFRIELGEIESVLAQHQLIKEAIVIGHQAENKSASLVAYVVLENNQLLNSKQIREYLSSCLPNYMIPAQFVFLDDLPLTPNGKVDRKAVADQGHHQLGQAISEKTFVAPETFEENALAKLWQEVLRIDRVGMHDNFFELGGDSILSLQIVARANQAGLRLTPRQLFQHQTIAELAAVAGTLSTTKAFQGVVTGSVPLTPIQKWFFEQNLPEPHHWNQSFLLEVPPELDLLLLEKAMPQLLLHHDALRLRFVQTESGWQQLNAGSNLTLKVIRVDLSALPEPSQGPAIEAAAAELQASLNLSEGVLVRVALFELGADKANRLLIVIHHLAVDGVSLRILLQDLETLVGPLRRAGGPSLSDKTQGETLRLPPKTTSFKQWSEKLTEYAHSETLRQELDYWLKSAEVAALPVDYPARSAANANNNEGVARTISGSLTAEETQALLQEVPAVYNTQINDLLLTALVQAFSQWTGVRTLKVDLEGHGREEVVSGVDLSRTVGWFTTVFPVVLTLSEPEEVGNSLMSIKEQLRRIPKHGIGYGLLRYLSPDTKVSLQGAEVLFNYLGQFDQIFSDSSLFRLADESSGPSLSLQGSRSHLLEINALVVEQRLQVKWKYSENVHRRATIERLATNFVEALRLLIAHCHAPEAGGYTPSDFPLAKLDEQELKQLSIQVNQIDGNSQGTKMKNVADVYTLSPMQEGMLFHTLYSPESAVYFEQYSCTLYGDLNVSAFKRAWQQVVDRHPILRTAFIWTGLNKPLQVVRQQVRPPWQHQDWRDLSPVEQEERLASLLQTDRERGFDLSKAPLMRMVLIRLASDAYRFIWSSHHVLLDGWSTPLLFNEVFAFYEAFRQDEVGEGAFQLKRTRPYRDYIAWLQQQDLCKAETFWKRVLKDFTAPTSLRVSGAQQPLFEGIDKQQIKLSESTTAALHALAQQHRLTLNTLVQGAWSLLLSHYSGENDVVFGTTVSGRPATLTGVENMVGLFINTLPVRVRVSPEAELLSWLKEIQAQLVEMREYEYSPLVEIQGWSDVPRDQPLFESIVVFENYPKDASLQKPSKSLQIHDVRNFEQTNYPLTVIATPVPQLRLDISYDGNRFDGATITRMLGHMQTLLEGMIANNLTLSAANGLERRVSELPLLTEAERHQLLVEWNNLGEGRRATPADYPLDTCFHKLFEEQVERTPDALAVLFNVFNKEGTQLTYRELNHRANQLARHLQKLGVGPEVVVGICLERSLEMIVSMLAVFKAGGVYLPLDPTYPKERLAYMLADSQPRVLLTQTPRGELSCAKRSGGWGMTEVLTTGKYWETIVGEPVENAVSDVTSDNLAYIIYTSGSTGKPKGVMVTHRGLGNLAQAQIKMFDVRPESRMLQFASLSFDASVAEIVVTLLAGATLCLASPTEMLPGPSLMQLLREQSITVVTLPPSALALLNPDELPALRTVVSAGEACSADIVARWAPGRRFINAYGPTETTVCATMARCVDNNQKPPIGRPISNTQIYLLDQHWQPVPIGVPGELYIGGIGLARGYMGRPDLTEERFIPNPFSDEPGARLYKSGDLARYISRCEKDLGNIELLGRLDHQVKIRGFRIELGEIEVVLNQHPAVAQTVVAAREDVPGDKRLVAYVVLQQKAQQIGESLIDPSTRRLAQCIAGSGHRGRTMIDGATHLTHLRHYLSEKLPNYMVPSAFVPLNALPLTPNGKVNRRALPAPLEVRQAPEDTFVAPQDELELQLTKIWEQVLKIRPIGRQDNFFELGGHSLLAVQLFSQIENITGRKLPLATLFGRPTVAQLAAALRDQGWSPPWSSLVPIQPGGAKRPFFCVPGGGGNVLIFADLARALGSDQPFYGLQAQGLDGKSPPYTQIEEMAAHYVREMRTLQPEGPYLLGGMCFGALVALEMAQQLHKEEQKTELFVIDTLRPDNVSVLNSYIRLSAYHIKHKQFSYVLQNAKQKIANIFTGPTTHPFEYMFDAHDKAQRTYIPQPYSGKITLFKNEFNTLRGNEKQMYGMWFDLAAGELEMHTVPGCHGTILDPPYVHSLAEKLGTCLGRGAFGK